MFICLEILEASRYKVRQCKSDRGVSTASSRYLALFILCTAYFDGLTNKGSFVRLRLYPTRHPHNSQMTPYTHNLSWVQYFLLDVVAFVVLVVTILSVIIVKLLKFCCSRKKTKNKTE